MKFRAKDFFSFTSHAGFGSSLPAWWKITGKNIFSIHPLLLPKIIFISGAVILSTPLRWIERLSIRSKIKKATIVRPVFILGHPRSGTTFLHYLLCKDPSFGFCSTSQAMLPHLFLSYGGIFSGILSKALPEKRPMDNLKMGTALPKEEEFALACYGPESLVTGYYFPKLFLSNLRRNVLFENNLSGEATWKKNFDHFLKKLSLANPGLQLILKSPANTARIRQILSLYPDAKFIHICRNPFDVFQSHLHLFKKLLPMLSFQEISDEALEEIVLETYVLILEKYFAEKKLIPSANLVEIRYEDFTKSPMTSLEEIYAALSLEGFENARPQIEAELRGYENYSKNKFTLSKTSEEKIRERWGFAFEKFGYSTTSNQQVS